MRGGRKPLQTSLHRLSWLRFGQLYLSIEDFKNDDDDDGDGDDGHYLCSKELLDPAGTL